MERLPEIDSVWPAQNRRYFLSSVATALAGSRLAGSAQASVNGQGEQRSMQSFQTRLEAARLQRKTIVPSHPDNGDETTYSNRIANFSKGLPHDVFGEVDPRAYDLLRAALESGDPADFERIPLGCPDSSLQRKLVNPMAGLAFDLEGADSHQLAIPPAPRFNSAEQGAEMVELYWQALLRDIPFEDYGYNSLASQAASDLSKMESFRGPKTDGRVTPQTLFRGSTPGDLQGPYVSQFLCRPVPYGAQSVDQRIRPYKTGLNHITQFQEWLEIQNGFTPGASVQFDDSFRYIRSGRDIARWVHVDLPFQAYLNASLILASPPEAGGMGAPLGPLNPYNTSSTQSGFGTFGVPHISTMVAEVATRALKAVWFQKWFVHRRLRPEAFGGCVHQRAAGLRSYSIHPQVLNSPTLQYVFSGNGSYLLPQAFPEGSPLHPSYGAGHATVAGACVTILKAFFDETFVVPNPVVPAPDGLTLTPYAGNDLTVGGELNKLAANIAIGRNFAGIHWRSDYKESLRLGEAVAISVLQDQLLTYREPCGFSLTRFDGSKVTI